MQNINHYDFNGKTALIRADFNVPLNEKGEVTDDTRIRAVIPTIQLVITSGGSVVLLSHLGRPKNGPEEKFSLKPVRDKLAELMGSPIIFGSDALNEEVVTFTQNLEPYMIMLVENIRFYKEETAGDRAFAEKLSRMGDVYINDAFGTAHRAHASTTIVSEFFEDKMFGLLMQREVENIDRVMHNAEAPYTAIIGGAKVSSKISIITNLLDKIDHLIIGGGMAYTFAKAQGGNIGNSLVEEDYLDTALEVLAKAKEKGVSIHLPEDTIAGDAFDNNANRQTVATNAIPDGWMGLDIGPKATAAYSEVLANSKTILWNGPMGVFEMENFAAGTKNLADAVASSTENGAFSLIGGGDSVAAAKQFNVADRVSYISTGGGALLEYMEGKELPGIKAIRG